MTIPVMDDWSDDEVQALVDAGNAVLAGRWAEQEAPAKAAAVEARAAVELDEIARGWRAAHGGTGTPDDPVPWVPAQGAHRLWPAGSWVTHNGAVWTTTHPANPWEPGAVGARWVRQDDPDPDTGHIPWAVGQDVKVGDERTHAGRLWRAKVAHVTHEGWVPSIHTHAVWTDLGPLEDA